MPNRKNEKTVEHKRLKDNHQFPVPQWYKWGPYVAERAWGTVREDYSPNGEAWNYFPFDRAHSKAYRWGEDGIAGWCDRYQVLVFSPAFWNGRDPILKERLFGLSSHEGNHAEDVKECYYYLDGTPTHSYMKYLYKYPQAEFPYQQLREENQKRSTQDPEYELIDTGVFEKSRYFDIFIEYAKASPEDLCVKIEVFNRGDQPATLHLIPQLWFRNQWAWGDQREGTPQISRGRKGDDLCLVADEAALHPPSNLSFAYRLGKRYLYGTQGGELLFTDNETRFEGSEKEDAYYKDGFHRKIIRGEKAVNPIEKGTKGCFHYQLENIPPQSSRVIHLRFTNQEIKSPLKEVEKIVSLRKKEADQFYAAIHPERASADEKLIQRQAFAGILWSKQIYLFDVNLWFKGDNTAYPPPPSRTAVRNGHWRHLNSMRILIMPDKWEYPWFAAWDQAFHCLVYAQIDLEFAKEQLWLLLFDQFQHPNGQIPAYEWEFSDVNPPVQAWAALLLYGMEKERRGKGDLAFLERCFHKLLINFAWWVNKVDSEGNNVFEGGFLGMDNISVVDRSMRMASGIKLQQSDGTGWMALFCLNLMRIALELSRHNRTYEALATKFFEHYVYIAHAMKKRGSQDYELWSDHDGFFYDVLTYPDGRFEKFRVRSIVGIIPLYAVEFLEEQEIEAFPEFKANFLWFLKNRPDLVSDCIIPMKRQGKTHYLLTVMNQEKLKSVLRYVWDPSEFRANFGFRSLSKFHEEHPFTFQDKKIGYEPAESLERIKGGNSNWRGPIWMPANYMLIDALKKIAKVSKNEIKVQVDGEKSIEVEEIAAAFASKLVSLFKMDASGSRPCLGPHFPFKKDPHWVDHILFYEYYHPETGKGLGASHQTGWSALVANLIDELYK
jgi:hypothetical protein